MNEWARLPTRRKRTPGAFVKRSGAWLALGFAALLLLLLPRAERSARASNRVVPAVAVGKSSPGPGLSRAELRGICTNEGDNDRSGERYVPFNPPPHTVDRVGFDQVVLGMSPDDVSQFWIERKIRGL